MERWRRFAAQCCARALPGDPGSLLNSSTPRPILDSSVLLVLSVRKNWRTGRARGYAFGSVKITLNGIERQVASGETVASLLDSLGIDPRRVAVELNREIVRKADYSSALAEGDRVEVVHFVGGG